MWARLHVVRPDPLPPITRTKQTIGMGRELEGPDWGRKAVSNTPGGGRPRGRFAGVTVGAGWLPHPAPKRVVEGAHLRVADAVSDLGDSEARVFEQVQRQGFSHLGEQIRV